MATRCLGRARLTIGAALPLLFNFLRAVDLASFRAGDFAVADFLVARDLAAAREAGLLDFFLTDCFLAIPALPVRANGEANTRGGRRHCERSEAIQNLRTPLWIASSLALLATTWGDQLNAAGTHRRRREARRA